MSEGTRDGQSMSMEELIKEAREKMPPEEDLGEVPLRRASRWRARRILREYALEPALTDEDEPWVWAQALSEAFPLDQNARFLRRPEGLVFFGVRRIPEPGEKRDRDAPFLNGGTHIEASWWLVETVSGIKAVSLSDHRIPMPWVSLIISRPSRRAKRVWISTGAMWGPMFGSGFTVEWRRQSFLKWVRGAQPVSCWMS